MGYCPYYDKQCPHNDECEEWDSSSSKCTIQRQTELLEGLSMGGSPHTIGGDSHTKDTLANLNSKISDATLDDSSATRTPTAHDAASHSDIASSGADIDDAVAKKHSNNLDHSNSLDHSNVQDHAEAHDIISHTDTTATGPELDELTGGGETALHTHTDGGGGLTLTISGATVFGPDDSPEIWTTLDLSGTVGANRAIVTVAIDASADMDATAIKADDDAGEYYHPSAEANAYGNQLGHHEQGCLLVLECHTSTAGKIKWKTENSQTATIILQKYLK